ncbi:uncharacterized protein EI90DRAFT_3280159 [Cantharellus anzutake]|uniref:uncharacterized protein n=1 Tax=Cantharellus anzutake TaxID=1750568 RepID=UPI001908C1AB|nr:uncharacterized protein EI90DRAFT_3280159 [Cantharellus anzutake]KAF8335049.1 hypothetical protein EI90DRAFT_3280159 [Cantharellus anzutake]
MFPFTKRWDPKDKHCYVSGGSTGLGLALSVLLVKAGAHVSIVARNQEKLDEAIKRLESLRVHEGQIIKSYSFSLSSGDESTRALDAACALHGGKSPDALFLCAGASRPRFIVDSTEQDMLQGMVEGYWVQAWSAIAAVKRMAHEGAKGKIVLVGSTLSYMAFVGYGSYTPAKHALRGFSDTLRNECLLYGIDVHFYAPNTMHTAGYEVEQQTKPWITNKIEEGDSPTTSEKAAASLLKGVQKGQAHIAGDLITHLFRASTRGAAPYNNPLVDGILGFIAWIGVPIWRRSADSAVRAHRTQHAEYLRQMNS